MATPREMRSVAEEVRPEYLASETLVTRQALRYLVIEAVSQQKGSLFGAQVLRSSAVEMAYLVAVKREAVARRDRLQAPRTSRRSHCRGRQEAPTIVRAGLLSTAGHRASHQRPPRGLEFPRDVALATLHVAPLDRQRLKAPASFAAHATVKNHVPALVGEYVLKIPVSLCSTRHDEEKLCHDRLRLTPASVLHSHRHTAGTRRGTRCIGRRERRYGRPRWLVGAPFVIPDLETSDVQLKGPPAKVHRDPFHQHLVLERIASQPSHLSPSLRLLQTFLMPSCGRRPSCSLRRMRK